jgi:UDP-N-acetylglucosamine 2-epimerase (non-hydrolysing)
MTTRTALVLFGTRPEAIKVAPVIFALRESGTIEPVVAVTAQHREMLDQVLELFGIRPAFDLGLMRESQSLAELTARIVTGVGGVIREVRPDVVLVQGDTTTTFAGALSAFYEHVPVAHVEAGYRTGNRYLPYPEEINRRLVSELADLHLAANETCAANLRAEGHPATDIHVVGNTGIDALFRVLAGPRDPAGSPARIERSSHFLVLMTMHRRESWGGAIAQACRAARTILERNRDTEIVFATHLNPVVREAAASELAGVERVRLVPALGYAEFARLLEAADIVMSDSGGVHEEALALGKPLLLLRDVSEWPEAIEAGLVRLVGSDETAIVTESERALAFLREGGTWPRATNPLADGHAAERVVRHLADYLEGRAS